MYRMETSNGNKPTGFLVYLSSVFSTLVLTLRISPTNLEVSSSGFDVKERMKNDESVVRPIKMCDGFTTVCPIET